MTALVLVRREIFQGFQCWLCLFCSYRILNTLNQCFSTYETVPTGANDCVNGKHAADENRRTSISGTHYVPLFQFLNMPLRTTQLTQENISVFFLTIFCFLKEFSSQNCLFKFPATYVAYFEYDVINVIIYFDVMQVKCIKQVSVYIDISET